MGQGVVGQGAVGQGGLGESSTDEDVEGEGGGFNVCGVVEAEVETEFSNEEKCVPTILTL